MKDVSRMVYTVADMLDCRHAPGAAEFRAISGSILPTIPMLAQVAPNPTAIMTGSRDNSLQFPKNVQTVAGMSFAKQTSASPVAVRKQPIHNIDIKAPPNNSATPAVNLSEARRISQGSLSQRRPSSAENLATKTAIKQALQQISPALPNPFTNVDYLQFKHPGVPRSAPRHSSSTPLLPSLGDHNTTTHWNNVLDSYIGTNGENGHGFYDNLAVYPTGTYLQVPRHSASTSTVPQPSTWSPEVWAYNMEQMQMHSHIDQSLGFSDESLSGSEDFSSIDASSNHSEHRVMGNALMIPPSLQHDTFAPHQFSAVDLEALNYW